MAAVTNSSLFSLLVKAHSLPNLPNALSNLTFPDLLGSWPAVNRTVTALERDGAGEPLFDEIRRTYADYTEHFSAASSSLTRLFALIRGECVILFTIQRSDHFELISAELTSSFAGVSIFLTTDRSIVEKIFRPALFEKIAPLLPPGEVAMEELSPTQAIEWWGLREEQLDPFLPNRRDNHRRTPLHHAAQAGNEERVKKLVTLGVEINPVDLKGHTPLHLAALEGHLSMVQTLLSLGGDPTHLTWEEESLFHTAAERGDLPLLSFLLGLSAVKELLDQKNKDGETPLYRAVACETKPEVIRLLIEAGANVNHLTPYGYTPLHWAAEHGHIESARLLIQAGSWIGSLNLNGKSPFDLAVDQNRDEIIWLMISDGNRPIPPSIGPSSYNEGAAYRAFVAAYELNDSTEQLFWLEKLGAIYLKKGDLTRAAHLFNGALAIAERARVSLGYQRLLPRQIERIEWSLIEQLGKKRPSEYRDSPLHHREELRIARERAYDRLDHGMAIEKIQKELTNGYLTILNRLIDECISILGPADPQEFAVIGLGSIARREASPYSDLEFAFLIRNPERLVYFQELCQLLELKMVNMGETNFPVVQKHRSEAKSLVPNGFSMDIGGLSPRGKEGIYELIGTPEELAQLQTEEWLGDHQAEIILVNALRTTSLIRGDVELATRYQNRVDDILNRWLNLFTTERPIRLRRKRAIELMRGYAEEFAPRMGQARIDLKAFDVKKELYRLPQSVISALALFEGIKKESSLEQIDKLVKRGRLSAEGGEHLKRLFRTAFRLRFETHRFYKTEREILCQTEEEGLFTITPRLAQELLELFRTLVPLKAQLDLFLKGDTKAFAKSSLYDSRVGLYDPQQKETGWLAIIAVILNPNSYFCRLDLGQLFLSQGERRKAVQQFEEALRLVSHDYGGRPHREIVKTQTYLGSAYRALRAFEKAITNLESAQSMASLLQDRQLYSETSFELALLYEESKEVAKATEAFEMVLMLRRELSHDRPSLEMVKTLNRIGTFYRNIGNIETAVVHHESSVAMANQVYKKQFSIDRATALIELGQSYQAAGYEERAVEQFNAAIESCKNNFSMLELKSNPIETIYLIGSSYAYLRKIEEANKFYELLRFYSTINQSAERLLLCLLARIGAAYEQAGAFDDAIKINEKILNFRDQLYYYDEEFLKASNRMGDIYKKLAFFDKAVESYRTSFEIALAIAIDDYQVHPEVITAFNALGGICNQAEEKEELHEFALLAGIEFLVFTNSFLLELDFVVRKSFVLELQKIVMLCIASLNRIGNGYANKKNTLEAVKFWGLSLDLRDQIAPESIGEGIRENMMILFGSDQIEQLYPALVDNIGEDHAYTQDVKKWINGGFTNQNPADLPSSSSSSSSHT